MNSSISFNGNPKLLNSSCVVEVKSLLPILLLPLVCLRFRENSFVLHLRFNMSFSTIAYILGTVLGNVIDLILSVFSFLEIDQIC